MQQDAHEFLNYLLNTIAETVEGKFTLGTVHYTELDILLNACRAKCNAHMSVVACFGLVSLSLL